MLQKILGTFIITLFLAETFFIYPNVDFSEIQDSKDSVMLEQEFIPDNVNKLLANAPFAFTENRGQLENDDVRFYAQGGGVWFTDDGVWFELREYVETRDQGGVRGLDFNPMNKFIEPESVEYKSVVLKQEFVGVNIVRPEGRERLSWDSNFFYGNDSTKWCTGVPNYLEIYYKNLYDGIDLRYYSNNNGLKYEFIVHPGAKHEQIRIKYFGVNGLEIDDYGNLIIETSIKDVVDSDLFIYQNRNGSLQNIKGRFVKLDDFEYGFKVEPFYDEQKPIIIDPHIKIGFSTYFGGTADETSTAIKADKFGNIYLIGLTASTDLPKTPGANDTSFNGDIDVFIAKFSPTVSKLIYSSFIGGNGRDFGSRFSGLAIDPFGNCYVSGSTNSSNFPITSSAFDKQLNGSMDIFVLKMNSTGSNLIYSTYIGGDYHDESQAIIIDINGSAFITGNTNSINFPTSSNAYIKQRIGTVVQDIFVLKLNPNGSMIDYSTYMGGTHGDGGAGIALDPIGNAYVTGTTQSKDFPTTPGAFDRSLSSDNPGTYVFKLNFNGSMLIYSTYVEGLMMDWGQDIALDQNYNAVVVGVTNSATFPTTPGAFDESYNGELDAFVFKLNHNGSALNFSTYLGGDSNDEGLGIVVDSLGNPYVTGRTVSPNFPTTPDAYNQTGINLFDAFMVELNSNGSKIIYSTYIGGDLYDGGYDIDLDWGGNILITGPTQSNDFPTTQGAFNRFNSGLSDAFIFKFSNRPIINITSVSLLKNEERTTKAYSKFGNYTLRINFIYTGNLSDLGSVLLSLDPKGVDIKLAWDYSTGQFTKTSDLNNYITLEPSSSAYNIFYYWNIEFNLTFNWNYPDEDIHSIQVEATSIILTSAWYNKTQFYCVENDLEFNGTLSVKDEYDNILNENDLIRGGENLNWTGLKTVYEGTTDIYPPTDEFDVNIWNEASNSWSDSPVLGENFTIQANVDSNTDLDGNLHIINLSGIPPECDATNETFTIRIDGDDITFSNPIPDYSKWQTTFDVEVGINITDIGGGFVNGSSVKYCFSTDNGTNWSEWTGFPKLKSEVSVNPKDVIYFPEGRNNLIKWQAGDSVGNGPVESEEYRIFIDTEDIIFSNGYPTKKNESPTENVEVGITISDITSSVDTSTIEYAISTNKGATWGSWVPITGIKDDKSINVSLNLTFPNGTGNRIKWRASDIAGNGPKESKVYVVIVNTWLLEWSIPKVKLWNPPNGSIIASTALELSWRLVNKDLLNVTYDVYLDTVFPPVKINHSGIINTTVIIENLSNGGTYYWTVIPKTDKINGSCESGVWSFTIIIPIPKINLISPENNSIITDFQPGLSWSVEYDGTEILTYDVYFGTSEDPELEFKDHPSTNCFIKERLTDGETYCWKVVSWADDYPGSVSETWSFTVKKDYLPHFELELFIIPLVIELPPGDIRQVKAIVSNLGELEDSILLRIEVPPDSGIGANVDEPSIISVIPHAIAEFNIIVTTSMDAPNEELILTVVASSRRAPEFELMVEEEAELTVKIMSKEKKDADDPWLSLSEFWIIFLIIIMILIVLIIVWVVLKKKKISLETKDESTPEDALKVKPESVPEAVISVGKAPPTTTSPQLPETTANVDSEQQTQTISKVPTLASSTTPGQVPETQQIPQATQVPQLPSAQPETSVTIEESTKETTPELDKPMEIQQEISQNSQEKD